MVKSILNKIKDIFEEKDIKYYCEEEIGCIGAGFPESAMAFEVKPESVELKMLVKGIIPEDKQRKVQTYLNRINCILKEGHMEIREDGIAQFRIYTDIMEQQDISEYRLLQLMAKGMATIHDFREGMFRVALGESEPDEAFAKAIEETIKKSA